MAQSEPRLRFTLGAPDPIERDPTERNRALRISYFMLFRLAMLAGFTVLATAAWWTDERSFGRAYTTLVWGTLLIGYLLTLLYARLLPRVRDLARFAAVQTTFDILGSAVAVHLTGGVDSGFVTLYLIAVLGASTMGTPRQIWASAASVVVIYLTMAILQATDTVEPLGHYEPLGVASISLSVLRTLAAVLGVTVLSAYLNTQLASSVSQVGNLRALNENIVRSLTAGLLTTDLEGRILYFNPAARSILDLEDDDIGQPVDHVLPGVEETEMQGAEGRQAVDVETRRGRRLNIGLNRAPLLDADGRRVGHVVNFQDVTRLHELAERVRRNDRLAALGGMAASVAHEIRNPLAAISGSAELLASATLADEDQRLLDIIRREANRLSTLITDLLQFTRPRTPQFVVVDLSSAVAECCEAFRTVSDYAEIALTFRGSIDTMVEVDPAQLSQVVWNLLKNAAEAMLGQGRIDIDVVPLDDHIRVELKDHGPGIPEANLERIFDPFFTTKETGTGFGLAIVHRIVHDNNGSISVESELGRGTTFRLKFPRYVPMLEASDSGVLDVG